MTLLPLWILLSFFVVVVCVCFSFKSPHNKSNNERSIRRYWTERLYSKKQRKMKRRLVTMKRNRERERRRKRTRTQVSEHKHSERVELMWFFSVLLSNQHFTYFVILFHFIQKNLNHDDDAEFNTVFDTFISLLLLLFFWCPFLLLLIFLCHSLLLPCAASIRFCWFYFIFMVAFFFVCLSDEQEKWVCVLRYKQAYMHMHAIIIVVRCCLSQRCHCFDHVAFLLVLVLMLSLSKTKTTTTAVVIVNLTAFSFAVDVIVVTLALRLSLLPLSLVHSFAL